GDVALRFVDDSPLEEDGFEPSVPLWPRSVRGGPPVSLLPLQTRSGQPRSLADYREASARNSSALKRIDADARFSSKCAIEEVPGIGSMAGERCNSQASAIWPGVAPWLWAIRASAEFRLASLPAASGYQGIKAMPAPAHISISLSDDVSRRL